MKTPYTHSKRGKQHRQQLEVNHLIDEYLALSKYLEEHDVFEKLKRMEHLKTLMKASVASAAKDSEVILHGTLGDVTLSACLKERVVDDNTKLYEMLGHSRFISLAQFSLKTLTKVLTGEQVESATKLVYGSRKLKHISYIAAPLH